MVWMVAASVQDSNNDFFFYYMTSSRHCSCTQQFELKRINHISRFRFIIETIHAVLDVKTVFVGGERVTANGENGG